MLKHPDASLNRYGRVAENCDLLKRALTELDIPGAASWQFSRDASKKAKKKKAERPDLEDIGYSDAIPQHSSTVLGLLEKEGVDTLQRRTVLVMKGRHGSHGEFRVRWDFMTCDFSEWEEPPVSEYTVE